MSRSTTSVRITGKVVSDDAMGPSMVYTHTRIQQADAILGAGNEQTRVLYPQGQRVASGLMRGTRIIATDSDNRSTSAGRAIHPLQVRPRPSSSGTHRTAADPSTTVRLSTRARDSPVRSRDQGHNTLQAPMQQNGTGFTETERIIDERRNFDNELKRNADSAVRHRAEKAQKKAEEDNKRGRRAQVAAAEKERARLIREKAAAVSRAQAASLPAHVLPEQQRLPSHAGASVGSYSGGGVEVRASGSSYPSNRASIRTNSPLGTRRLPRSAPVASVDSRNTPLFALDEPLEPEQRGVPKLSRSYIMPRKEEFINIYRESIQRKSAANENFVPDGENESLSASSTGSPGVEIHPRRKRVDSDGEYDMDGDIDKTAPKRKADNGSDCDIYSDFEEEGEDTASKDDIRGKSKTTAGSKSRGPSAHEVQEKVGNAAVIEMEAAERQKRREIGKKAAEDFKRRYLLQKKLAKEAELAEQEKKERNLKALQKMAAMSRSMSRQGGADQDTGDKAIRKSKKSDDKSVPSKRPAAIKMLPMSPHEKEIDDAAAEDALFVANWASSGDAFVNRYQNRESPTLRFPDVLVDNERMANGLSANGNVSRFGLSPPRAANRYTDKEDYFDSDRDADYTIQRPQSRHEDVLIAGSARLSPSRHPPLQDNDRPHSVKGVVSSALDRAVDGNKSEVQKIATASAAATRKRPRSSTPVLRGPKKPFVAGSASLSSGLRVANDADAVLSRASSRQRSESAMRGYESGESLPPPPPPSRRNKQKMSTRGGRGNKNRRPRNVTNGGLKNPKVEKGVIPSSRRDDAGDRTKNLPSEKDLLSLMEEEADVQRKSNADMLNDTSIIQLQKVEAAMRESKEAILSLVQLETQRLELERQRLAQGHGLHLDISHNSVSEKSGSDMSAELGDLRASVASLLPSVLARLSLEKDDTANERHSGYFEEEDGVRYSTEGDMSSGSSGDESSSSGEDFVNMDMDETIAWNPEVKPKPGVRRNSNLSGLSFENEEYEQEEIELHLGDEFEDGNVLDGHDLTDEAGKFYPLSAEAEEYRRSAMEHASPPPCRASSRCAGADSSSPDSSQRQKMNRPTYSKNSKDSGSEVRENRRDFFQSDDPILNAQFGMLQDKREILAYYGSGAAMTSPPRPEGRPPGRRNDDYPYEEPLFANGGTDDDFDEYDRAGDDFDDDVFGTSDRRFLRENEYDDREYVSSRSARQGYYADSDGRLQKPSQRKGTSDQRLGGSCPFVFQGGQSEQFGKYDQNRLNVTQKTVASPPSLRNVGQLAGLLNRRQNGGGIMFRDDDEDDFDGDSNPHGGNQSRDGYVEGALHDDPRDVSIVSIFAKQQLKSMEDEKERILKERLLAEAKAMAETVLSAHRKKHADAEHEKDHQTRSIYDSQNHGQSIIAEQPVHKEDAHVAVSNDSEEIRDRTFWDALLLRPIGSMVSGSINTSEMQTSQSEAPAEYSVDETTVRLVAVAPARTPAEIMKDLPRNQSKSERKPSAVELNMRLMNAIQHHEQVVLYEKELDELQHAQSMHIASQMMKNASSQFESEALRIKYEQETFLQQQAYELSLASTLNAQQQADREAMLRQQAEWEEMQRRVVRHNDMIDRAHFEADAAQAVANIENTAQLLELERGLNRAQQSAADVKRSTSSDNDRVSKPKSQPAQVEPDLPEKSTAKIEKNMSVSHSMYSDDFDDGSVDSRDQNNGKSGARKEYTVDDKSADGYLKRLLDSNGSVDGSYSHMDNTALEAEIREGMKLKGTTHPSGTSKGLELLGDYQREMDSRLRAQENSFRIRLSVIKNKRDQQLHILQEQLREEEEMGLDPTDIENMRVQQTSLVQSIYGEARAELERERWSMNAKACRELRKFHILRNDMLEYEGKIKSGKLFSSPPRTSGVRSNTKSPPQNSRRSPQRSVGDSYASDFIDESITTSPQKKGIADPVRMRLNQSVESIIEESYVADKTGSSDEVVSDAEDTFGNMNSSYNGHGKYSKPVADESASGYDDDFDVTESAAEIHGRSPHKALQASTSSESVMDELRARQEAVRRKHIEVENLLKVKTDELSRQRELIRLEEEERELDELLTAAGSLDIKNSSDLHDHRKKMRDQARKRIEELSGGMKKHMGGSQKRSAATSHHAPIKSTTKTSKLSQNEKNHVSAARRKEDEEVGSYDEDFENDDDVEDEVSDDAGSVAEDIDDEVTDEYEIDEASRRSDTQSVVDEDDDYYDETFERENSQASLRRGKPTSQKSLRPQDSVDENGYYSESFVSEDGEMLRDKSSRSLLKSDSSTRSVNMGSSTDIVLLGDLESSIERHRQKVSDLRRQMQKIQNDKARVVVLKARQSDRNALLEEENNLIQLLEAERLRLHEDRDIIRRELTAATSPKGKSESSTEDVNTLERLGDSVDALEMSTIEEIAVSKARLALDIAEQQKREAIEKSKKAVKEMVDVLQEPLAEELAAFEEQALLEEDSFASNGADLSSSGGYSLSAQNTSRKNVKLPSSSPTVADMSSTSLGKKTDLTSMNLRVSVSQRVKELEAAVLIQKIHRGEMGRRAAADIKNATIEARRDIETNVIAGNLVEEHAFTTAAEDLVMEDSFASSGDSSGLGRNRKGEKDNSDGDTLGLEIAETDNLFSAIERLKSASDARTELEKRLSEKVHQEEQDKMKIEISSSAEVMSTLMAPESGAKSGMVFDEAKMTWIEVGEDKVDMGGFETSDNEGDDEDDGFEEDSVPLKLSTALHEKKPVDGNNMRFDKDAMAWIGGDDDDLAGFESDSSSDSPHARSSVAGDEIELNSVEEEIEDESEGEEEDQYSDDDGDNFEEKETPAALSNTIKLTSGSNDTGIAYDAEGGDDVDLSGFESESPEGSETKSTEKDEEAETQPVAITVDGLTAPSQNENDGNDSDSIEEEIDEVMSEDESEQYSENSFYSGDENSGVNVESSRGDKSLEKSALSLSAASEPVFDEAAESHSHSMDSNVLTNVDESQKDIGSISPQRNRCSSADATGASLGESGVETVNWSQPHNTGETPELGRIPSIEEFPLPAVDENDDGAKDIKNMGTLESIALSPVSSKPVRHSDEGSSTQSPVPVPIEEEIVEVDLDDHLSLPSQHSDDYDADELQSNAGVDSAISGTADLLCVSTSSLVSAGRLSPLSRPTVDAVRTASPASPTHTFESSVNSSFGSPASVGSKSGSLVPLVLSGKAASPREGIDVSVRSPSSNKPVSEKLNSPVTDFISSPAMGDPLLDSYDGTQSVEEPTEHSISEDISFQEDASVEQREKISETHESSAEKEETTSDVVDRITNEIWLKFVNSTISDVLLLSGAKCESPPVPMMEEPEDDDISDPFSDQENSPPRSLLSGLPPIAGSSSLPLISSTSFGDDDVPEDEKIQMHMTLTRELDDLYDFDDDISAVSPPKAALPAEKKKIEKSAADIEIENKIHYDELNKRKQIIRANFWRSHSLGYATELLYSDRITDNYYEDTLGNPNHQGNIITEDIFMELESHRVKRVAAGVEKIVVSMNDVKDLIEKNAAAFVNAPDAAEGENVDINDIMVYNKSVFDMCNDVLADLHYLRHFGKETTEVFSKKSAFANRIIAESIPLTTLAVASYVMRHVQKAQSVKKDIMSHKRSTDSLADSTRVVEEFERQYNFLLQQTVDETTDILMARLLVDTVQYCREKY